MIDLNKLMSQIDLQSLQSMDAAKLTGLLKEHQNNIIKFALIIASLIAVVVMFNDLHSKEEALRGQITQMQQKLDAMKSRDAVSGELDTFNAALPKKVNEFELITLLSDFAKSQHTSITSMSPAESVDMGLYDLINVHFNGVTDNFKDMVLFLRTIERSKYPLRIDTWSGSEDVNNKITFDVSVSAVMIHT
jgi:hypothetical protein